MPNSILIIGASARAAAQSAAAAGITVVAVDPFGDEDTRSTVSAWLELSSPDQLPKLIQAFPQYDILPVGGFESWQVPFAEISAARNVLATSPSTVQQLRSIDFLREVAAESAVAFPETYEFQRHQDGSAQDAFEKCKAESLRPSNWLLKFPGKSAGLGVHVYQATNRRSADDTDASPCLSPEKVWLQRRVPGRAYGASFLASNNGVQLLGVCRSLTVATPSHPFLYAGSVGPIKIPESIALQLQRLAENIISRTHLRGLFGIDFIFDTMAQQLWLLEINPRYTASMELLDPGNENSLVMQHVSAYRNLSTNAPSPAPDQPSFPSQRLIKKVVWAKRTIPVASLQNFLKAWGDYQSPPSSIAQITIHDIPYTGNSIAQDSDSRDSISKGTPVLTIISRALSTACNCLRQYREVLAIERQLYSTP